MNKKQAQEQFQKDYTPGGIAIPKPLTMEVKENKHGIDNVVEDLNVNKLGEIETIPNNTFVGNTSGADGPPTAQELGINTHFISKDNIGITVVNGLITLATSTSTSSSSSSSSTRSTSSSSSSSSSVSTSSSSSS